jgi:hypothetical protein
MLIKSHLQPFENYQLQQVSAKHYVLVFVGRPDERRAARLLRELQELLGGEARIEFKLADSLITPGGKIRNVVTFVGK